MKKMIVQSLALVMLATTAGAADLIVHDRDGRPVEYWKQDPLVPNQIQVRDKEGKWTKTIRRDPLNSRESRQYDREGRFEKEIRKEVLKW